ICTPSLSAPPERYAICDRTFEFGTTPSWAGHLVLGSASIEHFWGENPKRRQGDPGGAVGWGCNSGKTTQWFVSGNSGHMINIPSCIPDRFGNMGPTVSGYQRTRADCVPTTLYSID